MVDQLTLKVKVMDQSQSDYFYTESLLSGPFSELRSKLGVKAPNHHKGPY
jgi:hypothetical protein